MAVAAVEQGLPRWPRRRWRIAAVALGALLLLEVSLSLVWPQAIPRDAFLPRPPARSWNDGCNGHESWYVRRGIYWEYNEAQTRRGCPGR